MQKKKPSLYVRYDTFQVEGADESKWIEVQDRIHCGLQCPRCHAIMISSSELDRLDYLCKQCSFLGTSTQKMGRKVPSFTLAYVKHMQQKSIRSTFLTPLE